MSNKDGRVLLLYFKIIRIILYSVIMCQALLSALCVLLSAHKNPGIRSYYYPCISQEEAEEQ